MPRAPNRRLNNVSQWLPSRLPPLDPPLNPHPNLPPAGGEGPESPSGRESHPSLPPLGRENHPIPPPLGRENHPIPPPPGRGRAGVGIETSRKHQPQKRHRRRGTQSAPPSTQAPSASGPAAQPPSLPSPCQGEGTRITLWQEEPTPYSLPRAGGGPGWGSRPAATTSPRNDTAAAPHNWPHRLPRRRPPQDPLPTPANTPTPPSPGILAPPPTATRPYLSAAKILYRHAAYGGKAPCGICRRSVGYRLGTNPRPVVVVGCRTGPLTRSGGE